MERKGPTVEFGFGFSVADSEIPRAPGLQILVIAELWGTGASSARINDAEDLDGLIAAIAPELALFIDPSPFAASEPVRVRLAPKSMADLKPASLVGQVPALSALAELSRHLGTAREPASDNVASALQQCRQHPALGALAVRWGQALAALAQRPAAAADQDHAQPPEREPDGKKSGVDRILGMVAAPAAGSASDHPAGAVAGGAQRAGIQRSGASLAAIRDEVDGALAALLTALLHHPQVIALEATLRGLRFLRSRVREGLDVTVIDRGDEPLAQLLDATLSAAPAAGAGGGFDLALIEGPFGNNAADLERLRHLAEAAELAQVPTIVALASEFLDTPQGWPASLRVLGESPALIGWQALRRRPCARWLVATFNPFLGRLPHQTKDPSYREPEQRATLAWAQPGWLLLERVLIGTAAHGLPVGFAGRSAGCVDGLDLWETNGVQIPLRYALTPEQTADLADLGIMAPSCEPNRDRAYLLDVPSALATPPASNSERDRVTRRMTRLDFQLLAAHLARLIEGLRRRLEPSLSTADKAEALRGRLTQQLGTHDARVQVQTTDAGVEVTVNLGGYGLAGVPITLHVPV